MKRALIAVLVAAVTMSSAGCAESDKLSRFRQTCAEHGGFLVSNYASLFGTNYECIVNNQILYLPGFD